MVNYEPADDQKSILTITTLQNKSITHNTELKYINSTRFHLTIFKLKRTRNNVLLTLEWTLDVNF